MEMEACKQKYKFDCLIVTINVAHVVSIFSFIDCNVAALDISN